MSEKIPTLDKGDYLSIVFTHYTMTRERGDISRRSFESLVDTIGDHPVEIIVVDNGGSIEDSKFFLECAHRGLIQHYVRNSDNLWFGFARNQAIKLSTGKYLCVVDNDMIFSPGWLDEPMDILKKLTDEKLLVTPLRTDLCHRRKIYSSTAVIDGVEYPTNSLAGSNCFMAKREVFDVIGPFWESSIVAGSYWCRIYGRRGYTVIALGDKQPEKVSHAGRNIGYNRKPEERVKTRYRYIHNGKVKL